MTENEMDGLRQRYYAGMRAMSKEQMDAMALAQSAGMRQAVPTEGDHLRGMAQSCNLWPQLLADEPTRPPVPTRRQRFRQWWSARVFSNSVDGWM